ncbi:hypothetical protein VTN77DRAFT_8012 [Rasamsonia byssochlamydoides]|uniref:uncharacterized protein n=1 Tax=Rasamsonia byssochlamydoides TaxID=89139 RepID=UPI00374319E1
MSLTTGGGDSQLSDSKKVALQILDMFDPDIIHLIDGFNIDRSMNALTLTMSFHQLFGDFEIYFDPVPDQIQHTYKIDYVQADSRQPFP